MGSDAASTVSRMTVWAFQSTLPGWGATACRHPPPRGHGISIHAPRMGSDQNVLSSIVTLWISIHAPRMGSDHTITLRAFRKIRFQSTLPGWGATRGRIVTGAVVDISIHAPRMGSDRLRPRGAPCSGHFNPRSPDGERLSFSINRLLSWIFQSTLPGWGATKIRPRLNLIPTYFNPRSPDGERRCIVVLMPVIVTNFNPRSPDGERLSAWMIRN